MKNSKDLASKKQVLFVRIKQFLLRVVKILISKIVQNAFDNKIFVGLIMTVSIYYFHFLNFFTQNLYHIFTYFPLVAMFIWSLIDFLQKQKCKRSNINRKVFSLCESFLITTDRVQSREIYQKIYSSVLKEDKEFLEIESFHSFVTDQKDYDLMVPKIKQLMKKYSN